jgi:hypothetical protein
MSDDQSSLAMLSTSEGQLNAVFACYGSAMQHGQLLEEELGTLLIIYSKISDNALTLRELEAEYSELRRKTLGTLLSRLRKHIAIHDDSVRTLLDGALETRNFLAHHFFLVRREMLSTETNRFALLGELLAAEERFRQAAAMIGGIRVALSEAVMPTPGRISGEAVFQIEVEVPDRI